MPTAGGFCVCEVLPGSMLFSSSGRGRHTVVVCKVVRTRAIAQSAGPGGWSVDISLVAEYVRCQFNTWFRDWGTLDNIEMENRQSGRPIDVAVPVDILEEMIRTGQCHVNPVLAVLVDGQWVAPIPARDPILPHFQGYPSRKEQP